MILHFLEKSKGYLKKITLTDELETVRLRRMRLKTNFYGYRHILCRIVDFMRKKETDTIKKRPKYTNTMDLRL